MSLLAVYQALSKGMLLLGGYGSANHFLVDTIAFSHLLDRISPTSRRCTQWVCGVWPVLVIGKSIPELKNKITNEHISMPLSVHPNSIEKTTL